MSLRQEGGGVYLSFLQREGSHKPVGQGRPGAIDTVQGLEAFHRAQGIAWEIKRWEGEKGG